MKRRAFLASAGMLFVQTKLAADESQSPNSAEATRSQMSKVAILDSVGGDLLQNLLTGLQDMGWQADRNLRIVTRYSEKYTSLSSDAQALLLEEPTLIAAIGGPAAAIAKSISAGRPLVFCIGGDPVEVGLVESLHQPGGTVTGSTFYAAQLLKKQLELLRVVCPERRVFGFLGNSNNPRWQSDLAIVRDAASQLSVQLKVVDATDEQSMRDAVRSLSEDEPPPTIIAGDPFLLSSRVLLNRLLESSRIPAIYSSRDFAADGGLIAYGASLQEAARVAGRYAGRILRGVRPASLPVTQPSKFVLVVNLRTSLSLGIKLPDSILAIADEIIE